MFRLPTDTSTDFIKRVIGLPGDTIQMKEGVLHINGTAVKREKVADFNEEGRSSSVDQYRETLPNGKTFLTLDTVPNAQADNTQEYKVPEGMYFMMGDNRDNSQDSRFSNVGFVPLENFIGRAEFLFFSISNGTNAWDVWKWPANVRFYRLFDGLKANR